MSGRTDLFYDPYLAEHQAQAHAVYRRLRDSARRRQARLLSAFTPEEVEQLWSLLRRIEAQVPHMNAGR